MAWHDSSKRIGARDQGFLMDVPSHVTIVVGEDDLEDEVFHRLRLKICSLLFDLQDPS